jgi:hypothetical protein
MDMEANNIEALEDGDLQHQGPVVAGRGQNREWTLLENLY